MGRDKSRMRLGNRTLLGWVKRAALATGMRVRVIRRDVVPSCGPLGGVMTGLRSSRAAVVVFLACDMPFVTPRLIKALLRGLRRDDAAIFSETESGAGFPFALRRDGLKVAEAQWARGRLSIQALASALKARRIRLHQARRELRNMNTPDDLPACTFPKASMRLAKVLHAG